MLWPSPLRSTPLGTVFERHHAVVHRYLARRLGVDLADELAAEVFAVAFAKRRRYDASFDDARPWLFGIATRLVRRHARREVRELRAYARSGVDPALPSHGRARRGRDRFRDRRPGARGGACGASATGARRAPPLRLGRAGLPRDSRRPVDFDRDREIAPSSRP